MFNIFIMHTNEKNIIITILNNIEHVAGAILLGNSIKKNGNENTTIIIVPFKMDKKLNNLLMQFFDEIIDKNISINDLKNLKYNKILYLDTNIIINKLLHDVFKLNEQFNIKNKIIYLIPKLHSDKFVENIMFGIDVHKNFEQYYGIQFTKIIPYIMKNKIPIEKRATFENLKLWFYYYREIINNNFELYENKLLENANLTMKYFLDQLSNTNTLFSEEFDLNKKKAIKKIYNIDTNKNINYYYLDISKNYNNEKINYPNKIIENINKINTKLTDKFVTILSRQFDNISIIFLINMKKHNYDNIFYEKTFELNGYSLKNILFNTYNIFVYKERLHFLNEQYDDNKKYNLNVLFYKSIDNIGLPLNPDKNIYVFSKSNQKISVTSIILNKNTMNKIIHNEIDFIKQDKLLNLKFQTLKKWIYINYDGNTIDNIIVNNIYFINTTIIDTNDHEVFEIKKLNNKKVEFFDIIFSKSNYYQKVNKDFEKYIQNVHNENKYYEIDGIKIHI